MTATTHRVITALTARLVIGALLLGVLILMGVGLMQTNWATGLAVTRP